MLYLCRVKPLRDHLRGFLIAAWAGDKIAEFSFPEISFYFPLRPWFFFVSPAYAGKSNSASVIRNCKQGSPPRMRGKVTLQDVPCNAVGITPACAGKRTHGLSVLPRAQDHPRMCGEKKRIALSELPDEGSPPHVRGKGGFRPSSYLLFRITPACAGKSNIATTPPCLPGDHPRMCGEKQPCMAALV